MALDRYRMAAAVDFQGLYRTPKAFPLVKKKKKLIFIIEALHNISDTQTESVSLTYMKGLIF